MFSVIIPLYNKEKQIGKTLSSVISQDYENFEIIIVDDGSTDGSVDVVKSIDDDRIIVVKQENGGPSKARNKGIEKAHGDWHLFLDADDVLLPGALRIMKDLIDRYPQEKCFAYNFYTCYSKTVRAYSCLYYDTIIKRTMWAWNFHLLFPRTGSSVFHKDVTRDDLFREDLRRFEDAEWLFRLMGKYSFVRCSTPVMVYNLQYAAASAPRNSIKEDYLGNLNFHCKTLGERTAVYHLYKEAIREYPMEASLLYRANISIWDRIVLEVIDNSCAFFAFVQRMLCRFFGKYLNYE